MFSRTYGCRGARRGVAEAERLRGVPLRHEQPEHPFRAQRAHAQRRHDAAVDAAGQRDDRAATAQRSEHLLPDRRSRSAPRRPPARFRRTWLRTWSSRLRLLPSPEHDMHPGPAENGACAYDMTAPPGPDGPLASERRGVPASVGGASDRTIAHRRFARSSAVRVAAPDWPAPSTIPATLGYTEPRSPGCDALSRVGAPRVA